MKIAMFSQGSVSSQWTLECLREYFDEVNHYDVKNIEVRLEKRGASVYCKGKKIPDQDCYYLKGSYRFADLLRSAATVLKGRGYFPIKDTAFTYVHDKLLTQLKLQGKVSMPATYFAPTPDVGKNILSKVHFPIIMKFPRGTHGKGVMYSESYESASSMLDALHSLSQPFLIQEYIETEGEDVRVFVIGDKVVAAMKRKASGREKRANLHAGASGTPFTPDQETQKVAVQASRLLGLEIAAIDVLIDARGPKVLEANLSPGLQGLTKATGINVAEEIAKYLYEKTKEWVDKKKKASTDVILKEIGCKKEDLGNTLFSNLDFRGERILLPHFVTKLAKFNAFEEYEIHASKGKLTIKPSGVAKQEEEE